MGRCNTLRGEINSCFFHLFFTHSTDCSYLRLRLHTPLSLAVSVSTSTSLTNTHTRAHTSRGDVRVSIHSAEASCTPGDSPGWWCWLGSGCMCVCVEGKRGRWGRGGGYRPVLQAPLNLHIPVHLAPGPAQECPRM